MSITALVAGKLIAEPDRRAGQSGKPYTLAKIVAHDGDAETLVSCIAFGHVAEHLGALGKGDAVAVSGRVKIRTWQGKDGETKSGLSITADAILTAYSMRKRRAAQLGGETGGD